MPIYESVSSEQSYNNINKHKLISFIHNPLGIGDILRFKRIGYNT